MINFNKTKFVQARNALSKDKQEPYIEEYKPIVGAMIELGADWGAAYERERAAKLVEALELISIMKEGFAEDNYRAIEIADKALASYESDES